MIDSGEQRQGRQDRQDRQDREDEGEATPRLMVGSLAGMAGEVAVVEARTGRVCWVRRTGRIHDAFALDRQAAYLAPGGSYALRKRLQRAESDSAEWQRVAAQLNFPTSLEARRPHDGTLLWTHVHPLITGQMHVEVESGVVIAANPRHFEAGAPDLQALDAASGKPLWTLGQLGDGGEDAQLFAAHGGRVYAQLHAHHAPPEDISALDIRSGRPLWQRRRPEHWVFSSNGALIGEQRPNDGRPDSIALLRAQDGAELTSFPTEGVIHQLSDEGIAYTDMNYYQEATWIAAVDAHTGAELWRTTDVAHDYLALDGAALCYSRVVPEIGNAEIGALDAATGERLWRWRSPASLGELLRLWGARRMPLMLWDSTAKSVATIREIVWRPWFRLRKPPSRFRGPPRQQTLGARLRDIRQSIASNVGWPLWNEFSRGQWRHPWQMHGSMNANWLAARWGIVFLGTWLGLFALDAASGRLLWHALPTIDLSYVDPALAP